MYYFHRESNPCFVTCPLYGVCPYLGVSVNRGFTVLCLEFDHKSQENGWKMSSDQL